MKYKVGDRVRVRSDLMAGKEYGSVTFCDWIRGLPYSELITLEEESANEG